MKGLLSKLHLKITKCYQHNTYYAAKWSLMEFHYYGPDSYSYTDTFNSNKGCWAENNNAFNLYSDFQGTEGH